MDNNNWETVNKKPLKKNSPAKADICEMYSKFGNCKCSNTNNKRHPFICSNIEKFGSCKLVNCRMFHPTQMKKKNYFNNNSNNNNRCHMYITNGYCECVDKTNHRQHPKLCKDYIKGICDNIDCKAFHIKKKNSEKDNLCSSYEQKGVCKDIHCRKVHPVLCKIYKCEQGNNCKYYHPMIFPAICNSIDLNERCKHKKCNFYHPLLCQTENCEEKNCLYYHRKKVIKYNDIIKWVSNNMEECIYEYEKYFKESIENYDEYIITNVRKHLVKSRRFDILEYFLSIDENIIMNKRRFSDKLDVYSELLWPRENIENEELFMQEFKKTMNILLKKNFDIFKFDNYWNESLFAVIRNENNKLNDSLKIKLYNYFLIEWKNDDIILRSFINMWNLITDTTKDKMWKYLIFLIYKNPIGCISYISTNFFKSHGTQITNNVKTKINYIIELLSQYPEDDNDIYHIYKFVDINWDVQIKEYIKILLDNLEHDCSKDEDNIYQNSLRYGTLLGVLYKNYVYSQSKIMDIICNFNRPNIIQLFIEFYESSAISDDSPIVLRFKDEIYKNINNNKDKFEIQRKLNLTK